MVEMRTEEMERGYFFRDTVRSSNNVVRYKFQYLLLQSPYVVIVSIIVNRYFESQISRDILETNSLNDLSTAELAIWA